MNFIFTNFNMIALVVWLAFFGTVALRTLRPAWVKNISYGWLVAGAVALHLLFGILLTWGQYHAWATASDFTRSFLALPLSPEVPLPSFVDLFSPIFGFGKTDIYATLYSLEHSLLDLVHPLFEGPHGYFIFYAYGHFFLKIIALFFVTIPFLLFLVVRSRTNPINFMEGDIMLIVLAMLISGWPGVIVLLPLGLISAILLSLVARIVYGALRTPLPPAFLLAAPIALLFAIPILTALHLYPLLKL